MFPVGELEDWKAWSGAVTCTPLYLSGAITKLDDVREALGNVAEPEKEVQQARGAPDSKIDWSKVRETDGWLQSVNDLPANASAKLRGIVSHTGTLNELNDQLVGIGQLQKPYRSWSEVTLAFTAGLKAIAKTPEQIAEALLAHLPCNQHVAKRPDKKRTIERAIARSVTQPSRSRLASCSSETSTSPALPKPSLANAVIALRALGIQAAKDLFHHRINVTYKGAARTIHEGLLPTTR